MQKKFTKSQVRKILEELIVSCLTPKPRYEILRNYYPIKIGATKKPSN